MPAKLSLLEAYYPIPVVRVGFALEVDEYHYYTWPHRP